MTSKSLIFLLFPLVLATAAKANSNGPSPDWPETEPPVTSEADTASAGIETESGFRLIEHRRLVAAVVSPAAMNPASPAANSAPAIRPTPKMRAGSNFRRAAFLPHVQAAEQRYEATRNLAAAPTFDIKR